MSTEALIIPKGQSHVGPGPQLPSLSAPVVPGKTVFGDSTWDLTPLCPRPTTRWIRINFDRCPAPLRLDIKHFFYLVLTTDTPLDQLDRPASARRRLAPSSLKTLFEDLKPFLDWLTTRGTPQLAELTDQDLHEYATHVAALPMGQNPKSRRLFALTRLWLLAPYLRPSARLRQPFWERDGIEQVIGKSEWTAENKSVPVHPATMSALLVWCLRIVEEAPRQLSYLSVTTENAPSASTVGRTTARLASAEELPWTGPLHIGDVDARRRLVTTACLITIAYLTGMRADEILGLRRGCCTPQYRKSRPTGGYEVRGRTYKSAVADGRSIPEGVDREHPWMAIKPVADAISVIEQLHDLESLFSHSLLKARLTGDQLDPRAPTSNQIRSSIENLVAWCNRRAQDLDRPNDTIPPDPDGSLNLRRLRRTLAWFIYRRPSGRVALGIQYGHLHATTTDGYGGRVAAGLRDLFPMEEAFAVSDTLHRAAERLDTHPTVSGPAAERYRAAVEEYRHRFEGVSLTTRQAAALMANPDLRVYNAPGQTLACCFDPHKALCRKDTAQPTPASTPDVTACDHRCANIARTDEHMVNIESELATLRAEHDASTTPEPLRHRIRSQIIRREAIIQAHQVTRTGGAE